VKYSTALLPLAILLSACDGRPSTRPAATTAKALPTAPSDDMPLKTYRALMPREPKTFTLECEISDYYNWGYRDARPTHYSVRMISRRPGGFFELLHGYAAKDSPLGRRLFEVLKDGKRHVLTVRVQYTDRSEGNSGTVAVVGLGGGSLSSGG
jgi:hypothetical protein